jgi:hypothetical protein
MSEEKALELVHTLEEGGKSLDDNKPAFQEK